MSWLSGKTPENVSLPRSAWAFIIDPKGQSKILVPEGENRLSNLMYVIHGVAQIMEALVTTVRTVQWQSGSGEKKPPQTGLDFGKAFGIDWPFKD